MDNISWHECIEILEGEISSNDHERWVKLLSFCPTDSESYVIAPNHYFITLLNTKSIWQKIETICHSKGYTIPTLISRESTEFNALNLKDITQAHKYSAVSNQAPTGLTNLSTAKSLAEKKQEGKSTLSSINQLSNQFTNKARVKRQVRKKQFEHYTFDNFYEGKSNQVALQVAKSLCDNLADQEALLYNPFFIYGHSGNGKTHLLHAIKNTLNSKDNGIKCYYQQAEGFVTRLVSSIRNKSMDEFKAFYRQFDVLLLDDVEFFVSKNSSMEEFFQLMNFFIEENRQIILTSDRLSTEIDLPHRICSRLASGLSASITLPDFELRVNILVSVSERLNLKISQELIYLIATKAKVSIRELYGLLKTLKANMVFSHDNREITLSDVDGILAPTLRSINVMVTPEQVIKLVSEYYGLSVRDLTSKVRRRPIVFARHLSMYLMRENTNFSLDQIGQYFSRDHSSVIHAIKKVKEEIAKSSDIRQLIDGLTNNLLNNNN